jgi:hypothetical protein
MGHRDEDLAGVDTYASENAGRGKSRSVDEPACF